MYKIIASSRRLEEAVVETEDGKQWFSWGPGMVPNTPREEDLRPIRPRAIEIDLEQGYFVRIDPPIEVEKLRDWPEVVRVRLEQTGKLLSAA